MCVELLNEEDEILKMKEEEKTQTLNILILFGREPVYYKVLLHFFVCVFEQRAISLSYPVKNPKIHHPSHCQGCLPTVHKGYSECMYPHMRPKL